MQKIRTKSARFSVRYNQRKKVQYLYLDPPFPKADDFEWALRMGIDKYFVLMDNIKVEDGGAGSDGLCMAAGNLTNKDDPCGGCPVKQKTGKPNCIATPSHEWWKESTYAGRKLMYQAHLDLLLSLYEERYGEVYLPGYMEEET